METGGVDVMWWVSVAMKKVDTDSTSCWIYSGLYEIGWGASRL